METSPGPPHLVIPVLFGNLYEGETWGGELSVEARPVARWRLHGAYSFLRLAVRPERPAPPGITPDASRLSSPRHQWFVRSSLDLPRRVFLDAFFRYLDEVPAQRVPSYSSLDLRLAWRPAAAVELAVVGQNLLDPHHKEWSAVEIWSGWPKA